MKEKELKAFFKNDELEWKPQSTGMSNGKPWAMVLCYIQARAIQDRLDKVMGVENWKDTYRITPHGVICNLSLWNENGNDWIGKENGSPETDIESFKGGISGAFKRVASSGWGIGRYLYELDTVFAETSLNKPSKADEKLWKYSKTKDGAKFWWKIPTMDNKYLPKKDNKQPEKPISNVSPIDTQSLFENANNRLLACKTKEELDKALIGIREKDIPYLQKHNGNEYIKDLTATKTKLEKELK